MQLLNRMSMRYRITLSVAIGLAVILGTFSYFALSAVNESKDAAFRERTLWAKAMALHVDSALTRTLERFRLIAGVIATNWGPGERSPEPTLDYSSYLYGSDLAILSPDGQVLWSGSPATENGSDEFLPTSLLGEAAVQRNAGIAACPNQSSSAPPYLCLAAPIIAGDGTLLGLLGGRLDPQQPDLDLIPSPQLGKTAHVELLTGTGVVALADVPEVTGATAHANALAPFIDQRTTGVKVHKVASGSSAKSHVVAYAPITVLPNWGIAVEQEQDEALALSTSLQRRMILAGLAALVLASTLAWLDVRQVVRPLQMLTARAARMAAGDLESPISSSRRDEVGTLARTFESMRVQLRNSLEEIERWNQELGDRVKERTREVEQLLEKVISAQEDERKRIARELHDDTAQALSGLAMNLKAVEDDLSSDSMRARERLERTRAMTLQTVQNLRKLIFDLRPADLDDLGLVPALRLSAESRLAETGIRLDLDISGMRERLPSHLETCLFRVVQEAITNVAKHAQATSVRIRLERKDHQVEVSVEDNGQGFDVQEVLEASDTTRGLGIMGMKERVTLYGGSFGIESAIGRGTRVFARIPIPREEGKDGG